MYILQTKQFLKTILFLLILSFYFQTSIYAANVVLQWDANTEPDLDHYVVYWGTSSENYTDNSENYGEFISRNDTTYTTPDLDTTQHTYYFAAKAVDTEGLESDYSNEANTVDGPFVSTGPKFCGIENKLKIKQKTIKDNVILNWVCTKHNLDHYVIHWGTSPRIIQNYSNSVVVDKNKTTYTITGIDLAQHTYYFAATTVDTTGHESSYSIEVSTKAPKIISPPVVTSITNTTAIIKWDTNEPSNSMVGYKNGYSDGCTIITHNVYTTKHSITLRNLKPNTSYIFFVGSINKNKVGPSINTIGNNPSNIYTFETIKHRQFDYEPYNTLRPKAPSWGKVIPNHNTRLGKPIYTLIISKQNLIYLGHL